MKQLLQEIANYLVTRPWQEVNVLITKIGIELQRIEQSEKVSRDIIQGAKGGEQIAKREKASETKA